LPTLAPAPEKESAKVFAVAAVTNGVVVVLSRAIHAIRSFYPLHSPSSLMHGRGVNGRRRAAVGGQVEVAAAEEGGLRRSAAEGLLECIPGVEEEGGNTQVFDADGRARTCT